MLTSNQYQSSLSSAATDRRCSVTRQSNYTLRNDQSLKTLQVIALCGSGTPLLLMLLSEDEGLLSGERFKRGKHHKCLRLKACMVAWLLRALATAAPKRDKW